MSKRKDFRIKSPIISGSIVGILIGLVFETLFYLLTGNVYVFGILMAIGGFLGMAIGFVYGRVKAPEEAETL